MYRLVAIILVLAFLSLGVAFSLLTALVSMWWAVPLSGWCALIFLFYASAGKPGSIAEGGPFSEKERVSENITVVVTDSKGKVRRRIKN